ncbi:valine--tRNA ligase [Ahrensia kielensis]|uniref:valine--tRNA ligase n=1 Tax=Ahrensia kielensis TaxID=76980 RepID=UPI00036A725F|nr:valine--tRNA ligase [Ahrensia kielensis]
MLDKTFDAANVEPQIAKKWDDANAFAAGAGAREGAEPFSIVIPPPNVTGSLHMGHALNNTLQDIMVRYQRMLGNNVLWQPGMDHAGIATQMVVERQLNAEGKKRNDFTRAEFIEKIWEWKAESGGTIFNQLKRLGASCDWSRERFTMDEGLSEAVLKVFVELYNGGLIYRGKRLVNWDPHFETAISDLEVENTEVDGHMWHFKYPLADGATYIYVEKDEDGNVVLEETRDYISIATTRPETMLGDGAVAVHPSDERYASIVGKLCEIPVGPKEHRRKIPIIADEYPDKDFGSGAVKITGAHDFNDYQVAKRNNIPLYRLMDTKASMRADGDAYVEEAAKAKAIVESGELPSEAVVDTINLVPDEYRGLDRFEARKKVIANISAEGLAVMTTVTLKDDEGNEREESVPYVENKKIMQPFGDRSKVVIEPMLTDQWFADAETLAKPALASVKEGRTNFVPKTWENTYYNWMENIQPWCISRQLWWGHQIPAWYGPDDRVFVAKNEGLALEAAIQHYISHEGPWKAWVENKIEASETQSILQRDPDVLDTWFSSALWPFSTLGWPEKTKELEAYYQTDVIVTGFDIIFFWVARMMMMGNHFMKDEDGQSVEPFHTVYVHALVRDKDGQKMSKSKGNVIDPLELMDEYGTDALRFTLAIMAAQGRDVRLDTDRIAGYRNFGTKLWNATRFAQMNDVAHDPNFKPEDAKLPVNRWILTELSRAVKEVSTGIDTYRFNDAASAAYKFVWNNFCDWYLELLKPVFQGEDEAAKKEAQACAAYVLDQAYKMLHPFMPFMTEELWGLTAANRETLICHAPWPKAEFSDDEAADEINWLIELVSGIRSVRAEMNVPPSAKAPLIFVDAGDVTRGRMERNAAAIQWLARVEALSVADVAPEGSAQIVVGESTACLPLGSLVDVAAESARIEKAIGKVRGDMAKIEGKLNNEKFVQNAKPEVVQAEREKLAEFKPTLENLEAALARVKAL